MSFAIPQENARRAYSQANGLHPVYIPPPQPPSAASSQHPQVNAAPYYQSHEASHTQENNGRSNSHISSNGLDSPSAQLQDHNFMYQLQHAAAASRPILPIQQTSSRASHTSNAPQIIPQNIQQNVQQNGPQNGLQIQTNGVRAESSESTSSQPDSALGTPDPNVSMIPPLEASFATFEELLASVNAWGLPRGYACVIGRSKRKGKCAFKKVLLSCDKGGTGKNRMLPLDHPLRKRHTTSRKTGCPFSLYAIETATEWILKYRPDAICNTHNHPPSKGAIDHPAARRLDKAAVAAVKALKEAGLTAQETLKQIKATHPDAGFLPRDIYNARAALARDPTRGDEIGSDGELVKLPDIYKRPPITAEDRIREECRKEVARVKEELDQLREESSAEIARLKSQVEQKDKVIEKFEMFIDICNGRVMAQRERLAEGDSIVGTA